MWHAYHSRWYEMNEFLMTVADHNNNGNCSSIGGENDNNFLQHLLVENRCLSPFLLPIR